MIDALDCTQARISLGAYVLGALEPQERATLDVHLAGCEGCRTELADIDGLPALLAFLSTEDAADLADGLPREPTDSPTAFGAADRPADPTAARGRRKTFRTTLLSVAAVVVISLAAVAAAEVGLHAGQADAGLYTGPALGPWQSAWGSNTADMHAIVRYRPMGWGTPARPPGRRRSSTSFARPGVRCPVTVIASRPSAARGPTVA